MKDPFRTVVDPIPISEKLSYQTPGLFLGSCFTTSIGEKMQHLKFPVMINPSGVLYNPVSIKDILERILEEKLFKPEDLHFENGLWFSLRHDTFFSDEDKAKCLSRINERYVQAVSFFKNVRFLFLTFGTARVYVWKKSGQVVANCHKLPLAYFERRMLGVEEIVALYRDLTVRLFSMNPDLQIVFTVSPIRHWKDGAAGNHYSKSVLHVAIQRLTVQDERLHYFPSYEIMMDDLRDYRFYAADMLHLSDIAVDYIWEKFRKTVIDPGVLPVIGEVQKILRAVTHRPFRPASAEYQKFREVQLAKIKDMEKRYPFLDLSTEKKYFMKEIP